LSLFENIKLEEVVPPGPENTNFPSFISQVCPLEVVLAPTVNVPLEKNVSAP
jgi:hypothetical protein